MTFVVLSTFCSPNLCCFCDHVFGAWPLTYMSIYHQTRFDCDEECNEQKLDYLYVEIAFVIWHQVDTDLSEMKSEKNRRDQETENRISSLNKQIISLQSENKNIQDKLSKLRLEKTQSQKNLIPIRFTIHNSWFVELLENCKYMHIYLLYATTYSTCCKKVISFPFCMFSICHVPLATLCDCRFSVFNKVLMMHVYLS